MRIQIRQLATSIDPFGCPIGPYRNHYTSSHRPLFELDDDLGGGGGDDDPAYAETEYEDESAQPDETTGQRPKLKALGFKKDDQMVMLPGMKKPISVKELGASLGLRTQHQEGLKLMGKLAEAIKNGGGTGGDKTKGRGEGDKAVTKSEAKDALAQLESMDLLDGKTMAGVLRNIETGTLTPLVQAVVSMAKELKAMKASVGSFHRRDTETEFDSEIKGAIGSLKLPRAGDKAIDGEDVLADIARDLFLSYDEEDQPKLRGQQFHQLVQTRVQSLRKFFRAYEKAELDAANVRARQRLFARPGAGTSANGKGKKMLKNSEAASLLFRGGQSADA